MRLVFDKKYDILTGEYLVSVRELDLDEELKTIVDGFDPKVKVMGEELSLNELTGKVFKASTREEAEKIMSEIRGALVETFGSLIARFKEAQSFNGSVVYEIDFNELFKE
ncbi:hypothetical protein [Thermococcus sp.]|uniref:hypothetical protein n=1 Tax=Thermococcus sp. TaxID=35749 RepID=UPI00260D9F57|nr:hypothetical protein [Thermococcus sp.]